MSNNDIAIRMGTGRLLVLAFASTAGVMVEFYDFFIYGYAAASVFPAIFFPRLAPSKALLFSYLAFGAGFPARLLGAFVFGHYGDRCGRKVAFLINIAIVGLTTCLTGLLPGYARLGLAAPILLVVLRIVQGIGLGGEFGGASALLAEYAATRRSRAFWISLANLGIPLGAIAASAALLFLHDTFATTGWRVAMLLSLVIFVPALFARYHFADTPLFQNLKQRDATANMPSFAVFRQHTVPILLIALILGFQQMDGYVSGTYVISFMKLAGIPLATTAVLLLIARVSDLFGVIASGPGADLLHRKTTAAIAIAVTVALSYPYARAIVERQLFRIALLQCLITLFGMGIMHGLAPVLATEAFPTKFRYSGAGIAYGMSTIVGGMIAPPLLTVLIGTDVAQKWFYIPLVYAVYGCIAMVALLFLRETANLDLHQLDLDDSGTANIAPDTLSNATAIASALGFTLETRDRE